MNKQDRQQVRTAADLERKYNLAGMQKAIKNNVEGINKVNNFMEEYMKTILKNIKDIESQLDGSITTHFYSGAPSLDTLPASEWTTDEDKNKHIGDMYYDKDTGKAYRFLLDEDVYNWIEIPDTATAEALALANAAKDTADGKRRVFLEQPIPPYDNGDLWLYNQEIYVCQISKPEGEAYAEDDFIIATKYTDNTLAEKLGDELTVLRGTVTTVKENADSFKIEIEEKVASIDKLQQETVEQLEKTSYAFGTEDLTIKKSGSEMETHISEDGMKVKKSNEDVLIANNEGVKAEDLHATTYLIIGKNSRFEDYGENRTGCFWIGS